MEPDPVAAVRIGLDKGQTAEEQAFNREPQDMLRAVPGVTGKNIKSLIIEMGNLREVANATVEELEPAVGKEAGRIIHRFFNKSVLD